MNEDEEEGEIKKANEAVDKWEDEEVAKRKKNAEGHKEEKNAVICPKCKLLVGEADFKEDELSEVTDSSIMTKINCVNCGYIGMPIEVEFEEYIRYTKDQKSAGAGRHKKA